MNMIMNPGYGQTELTHRQTQTLLVDKPFCVNSMDVSFDSNIQYKNGKVRNYVNTK